MAKPTMIFKGDFSDRYYAVRAYKGLDNGHFVATGEKEDVTDQILPLIQAAESRGRAEQAGLDALRVRQHRETVAELIEADAKHFSGETK